MLNNLFRLASCFETLCLASKNVLFEGLVNNISKLLLECRDISASLSKHKRHDPELLAIQIIMGKFISEFPYKSSETYKSIFCIKKIQELNDAIDNLRRKELGNSNELVYSLLKRIRTELISYTPKIVEHWKNQSQALKLARSIRY